MPSKLKFTFFHYFLTAYKATIDNVNIFIANNRALGW